MIYSSGNMPQIGVSFNAETVNSEEAVYNAAPMSSSSKSIFDNVLKFILSIQSHLSHLQFDGKFLGDPADEPNHILQEDYGLNQFLQLRSLLN